MRHWWFILFGGRKRIPNLLVAGAQKGGTTTLHDCLSRHPQVFMTAEKELHYFYHDSRRAEDQPGTKPPNRRWLYGRFDHDKARAARWRGESTPYYLFHPRVPERVARELPGLRCILLLRDPADRALSHYKMMRRFGMEDAPTFEQAVDLEPQRLAGEDERLRSDPEYFSYEHMYHSYLARGFYHAQLTRWLEHLPAERMLVIRSEIFFTDPSRALGSVAAFLGIDDRFDLPREAANAGEPGDMDPVLRGRLDALFADDQRRLDALVPTLPHHCW